jgi:transposase-like protein
MSIVQAECPKCKKVVPHETPGKKAGEKTQRMACRVCRHTWQLRC